MLRRDAADIRDELSEAKDENQILHIIILVVKEDVLMSRLKRVPADENELVLNSTGLSKLKREQKCLKRENGNHSDGQSA